MLNSSIVNKLRTLTGFMVRRFRTPRWPNSSDGRLLIHVGCGPVNAPNFLNVDALPYPHVHVVTNDIATLPMLGNQSADLIYMCHILEHLTKKELTVTLKEMHRILKPRGILRISVPDFDKIIAIYHDTDHNIDAIWAPLMGAHANSYDIHHIVFNDAYLTRYFKEVGFAEVKPWDPAVVEDYNFEDWASKKIHQGGKEYSISLNLEAIKW